jgi:hypothetical protein
MKFDKKIMKFDKKIDEKIEKNQKFLAYLSEIYYGF